MEIFDWLFSIEHHVVFVTGSISLKDLRNAMNGFMEAKRFLCDDHKDYIFPGFQRYVEDVYGVRGCTSKGWNTLITEHSQTDEETLATFYTLLRGYYKTLCSG